MTAQDVEEMILSPMLRLYVMPVHLRSRPSEQQLVMNEYVRSLERYPRGVLEQAWRIVVEEHQLSIWPPPGALVEAVRRTHRVDLEPSEEAQKSQRAREMADTYSNRFMKTSQLAKLAKREGWSGSLRSYVEASAFVQAQLIAGVKGVSFDSVLTRHLGSFDSAREALTAFRDTVGTSVERGVIRVVVPKGVWNRWKMETNGFKRSEKAKE